MIYNINKVFLPEDTYTAPQEIFLDISNFQTFSIMLQHPQVGDLEVYTTIDSRYTDDLNDTVNMLNKEWSIATLVDEALNTYQTIDLTTDLSPVHVTVDCSKAMKFMRISLDANGIYYGEYYGKVPKF